MVHPPHVTDNKFLIFLLIIPFERFFFKYIFALFLALSIKFSVHDNVYLKERLHIKEKYARMLLQYTPHHLLIIETDI